MSLLLLADPAGQTSFPVLSDIEAGAAESAGYIISSLDSLQWSAMSAVYAPVWCLVMGSYTSNRCH